jgi:membrane protein implicated in regulation of membrane protease activity
MMSYPLLIGISIAAVLCVFPLARIMCKVSLRVQFMILLGMGVTIGFIFLVMVQLPSFPEWFGVSLIAAVFMASLVGTRIFLRSLAQEDKKTEDEARVDYLSRHSDPGASHPHSAGRTP